MDSNDPNNLKNSKENIEYPVHWGGYENNQDNNPSITLDNTKLKNLFKIDGPMPPEAKLFNLPEINESLKRLDIADNA
jgi:hypothetical protein